MARILIVDDDPHTVRVMAMWLTRNDHQILEARNGREGLTVLARQAVGDVDLIITDMNMPVMDGIEFVAALRKELMLQAPIIMLSSRCDQSALAARLKPYDVQLYPKPFVPSRLVTRIDQLLVAAASS